MPSRPVPPASSLTARLFNVFATPGDVFQEVKDSRPSVGNWLLPLLLSCLAGVVSVLVIFSQDTIQHQVMEQKERAVEKQLRQMPKAQQEQARAAIEKFSSPTLLKTLAAGGAVVSNVGWLFIVALLVWLLGRLAFKADISYGQALEVCGLASMISVLDTIISTLLMVGMGSVFATPGPALLIREFDPANKLHLALAAGNVVSLWYLATVAIGLAKLSRASVLKTIPWVFVPWAVFRFGLIALAR